ncbi:Mediator of RNA polymerase II transcription subunit 15a, partial [Mucuna pruriens]
MSSIRSLLGQKLLGVASFISDIDINTAFNIEFMKESYLAELNELYQKLVTLPEREHFIVPDSIAQQLTPDQLEKLNVSKSNISPSFKEKLASYEKQIIQFIDTNRPMETMSPLQSGQLPPSHIDWQEKLYQKFSIQHSKS